MQPPREWPPGVGKRSFPLHAAGPLRPSCTRRPGHDGRSSARRGARGGIPRDQPFRRPSRPSKRTRMIQTGQNGNENTGKHLLVPAKCRVIVLGDFAVIRGRVIPVLFPVLQEVNGREVPRACCWQRGRSFRYDALRYPSPFAGGVWVKGSEALASVVSRLLLAGLVQFAASAPGVFRVLF